MNKNKNIVIIAMIILIIAIIATLLVILKTTKQNSEDEENVLMEGYENLSVITVEKVKSKTILQLLMNCLNEDYIREAYKINTQDIEKYAVYVRESGENKFYIVYLDYDNKAYKTDEINEETYTKIKNGQIDQKYLETKSVEANGQNSFWITNMTDEKIAIMYYNIIKNLIVNDNVVLYSILDENYKNTKFVDQSTFYNYCNNIKSSVADSEIREYKVDTANGIEQYTCIDNNKHIFIIKVTSALEYTVMLDDYTLESSTEVEEYKSSNDTTKISKNIDKFMKMIVNSDYQSAYNLLDATYKANNFPTLESYTNFVNLHFYRTGYYTIDSITMQGNYYVVAVTTKQTATVASYSTTNQIIMSLGEGTSFTMSIAK